MSICTAPVYKMGELNNLFIELTSKCCNQRCSGCYIDFPLSKNVKDFISQDKIKEALSDVEHENLYCIYLTGAEPMTHPDFNAILRLCLKKCNVCICTNGSFLNEKKIRFLKKVEDEGIGSKIGQNQIFFMLSVTHFDELLSDKVKYRGHFRQIISALKILNRYNFESVLSVQNYYDLDKKLIMDNFKRIFSENEIINTDIKINVSYPTSIDSSDFKPADKTDCMYGRVLSQKGVYSCPFLSNDYRGRVGSSFKDFSDTISAETDFCTVCSANNDCMFSIS